MYNQSLTKKTESKIGNSSERIEYRELVKHIFSEKSQKRRRECGSNNQKKLRGGAMFPLLLAPGALGRG